MADKGTEQPPGFAWIKRPEMLVGLSAILLSLCGLFIAVYEASLFRQAQRASVWPHVEVGASLRPAEINLWVENTGIGPARVRAATLTHEDETLASWSDLLRRVTGNEPKGYSFYFSMINGRVLPSNAPETIFSISEDNGPAAADAMAQLRQDILEGAIDISVCYCSVYDECWTSTLQDLLSRSRSDATPRETRYVEGCDTSKRSGI